MKKTISKIIIGLIALLAVFAVGCGYNNYITKKVMEKVEAQLTDREAQEFGAYYPVAAGTYYLAGSGIGTTDTSITLRSFTDPFSGEEYTMSDFGDIGYATIDPGTSKKEFISFTGISQDPNSSEATLTGVTRGLQGKYPYTASSTLAKSHSGGAKLIISNPPQHYEKYANRERNQTISGVWTFSSSSPPRYDTDSYSFITGLSYLVNKAYVDNVATSGAADASTNTKGLVEQATLSELMSSASSGDTTAPLFVPNQYFSTSSSATTSVVVTKSNGKINQNFWDLTEDFTWSGEHTFNGTTTLATTTFSKIPTLPASDPTSENQATRKSYVDNLTFAHMQVFTSSGTFTVPTGTTRVMVELVGGGGGGAASNPYTGAGGGGGGYCKKIIDVSGTSSIAVTVGAGGSAGNAGGTSSFGSYCSASGGNPGNGDTGGTGGIGSGGDINIQGSTGGNTYYNGINAGRGGSSVLGGGGREARDGGSGCTAGGNYGGGGGGAIDGDGCSGAPGVVIVYY